MILSEVAAVDYFYMANLDYRARLFSLVITGLTEVLNLEISLMTSSLVGLWALDDSYIYYFNLLYIITNNYSRCTSINSIIS